VAEFFEALQPDFCLCRNSDLFVIIITALMFQVSTVIEEEMDPVKEV
jgi:hypothetical protein